MDPKFHSDKMATQPSLQSLEKWPPDFAATSRLVPTAREQPDLGRIHREKKIRLPSKRAYWEHQFPSGAESDNVLLGTFCEVSWDDGIHRTQILAAWLITHFRLPPAPNYPSGPRHLPASYRQSCRFSPSRSVVLTLVQFQLITELP